MKKTVTMNSVYSVGFNNVITGVKDEKTINTFTFQNVQILITKEKKQKNGEQYFNVYFIDPIFRIEPLNNLNEQIPIENEPENWEKYLQLRYLEYIAWREFNMSIEAEFIEYQEQ